MIQDLFYSNTIKQYHAVEEQVLTRVLKQLVGREPLPEDGKRFSKVYLQGDYLNYQLAFDEIVIGEMVFTQLWNEITVTFKPKTND